jgi:hypothetical protein
MPQINDLPVELLCKILSHTALLSSIGHVTLKDRCDPFQLVQVCSRWNEAIKGNSSAWSTIYIATSRPSIGDDQVPIVCAEYLKKLQLTIQRSRSQNLYVEIGQCRGDYHFDGEDTWDDGCPEDGEKIWTRYVYNAVSMIRQVSSRIYKFIGPLHFLKEEVLWQSVDGSQIRELYVKPCAFGCGGKLDTSIPFRYVRLLAPIKNASNWASQFVLLSDNLFHAIRRYGRLLQPGALAPYLEPIACVTQHSHCGHLQMQH